MSAEPEKIVQGPFPISYATWAAADLFLAAGYPARDIHRLLSLDAQSYAAIEACYEWLHISKLWWRRGKPGQIDLETSEDLLRKIAPDADSHLAQAGDQFSLSRYCDEVRFAVYQSPYLGPFAHLDWPAYFIGDHYRASAARYAHNGEQVFLFRQPLWDKQGKPISHIDASSFRLLGDRWMRDVHRVYAQGEANQAEYFYIVDGADPDSFIELNQRYARDKQAMYYVTNKRLRSKSPDALRIIPNHRTPAVGSRAGSLVDDYHQSLVAADREHVYSAGSKLQDADPATFRHLADTGYYRDDQHVWYEKWPLIGVDPMTFVVRPGSKWDACDSRTPYCQHEPVSSSAEFERWADFFSTHPELDDWWWHREARRRSVQVELHAIGPGYWSDGERILAEHYDEKQLLDGESATDFVLLGDGYARGKQVYRWFESGGGRVVCLTGADPASLHIFPAHNWCRDKRQAWWGDKRVKIDPDSFEVLDQHYARDAKGLLCNGVRKKVASAELLLAIGGGYARIGPNILWHGKEVRHGALSADSARSVGHELLIDAAGHWMLRGQYRKPIADGPSFRHLDGDFFVDRERVFHLDWYGLRHVDGADPASFTVLGSRAGRDAHADYALPERGAD